MIDLFGGRGSKPKPEQPFHHLNSSIIWDVQVPYGVEITSKKTLNISVLRDKDTYGYFHSDVYKLIQSKKVRTSVCQKILQMFWPETVQNDLINFLSLPIGEQSKKRDPKFSEAVLTNFRHKCTICGFSSLFKQTPFGLDAAHIKWHAYNGPDDISNGLALCKLHHWAFDRGVISISDISFKVLVSSKFVGTDVQSVKQLEALKGMEIQPYRDEQPGKEFLQWHHEKVFIS